MKINDNKQWNYMPKHIIVSETDKALLLTYKKEKRNYTQWIPKSCLNEKRTKVKSFIKLQLNNKEI